MMRDHTTAVILIPARREKNLRMLKIENPSPFRSIETLRNDGNSLHTPSPLSAEPPLFIEGNIRTYPFIGNAHPVFRLSLESTPLKRGVSGNCVAQSPQKAVPAYDERGWNADTRHSPCGCATVTDSINFSWRLWPRLVRGGQALTRTQYSMAPEVV